MEAEENSLNIKSVIEKIIFVIFQSFIPKKRYGVKSANMKYRKDFEAKLKMRVRVVAKWGLALLPFVHFFSEKVVH